MTDHRDGAVGVTDDGVGNAAHQCPSHPVESPAARRYQVCLQFFGQVKTMALSVLPILRCACATVALAALMCSTLVCSSRPLLSCPVRIEYDSCVFRGNSRA